MNDFEKVDVSGGRLPEFILPQDDSGIITVHRAGEPDRKYKVQITFPGKAPEYITDVQKVKDVIFALETFSREASEKIEDLSQIQLKGQAVKVGNVNIPLSEETDYYKIINGLFEEAIKSITFKDAEPAAPLAERVTPPPAKPATEKTAKAGKSGLEAVAAFFRRLGAGIASLARWIWSHTFGAIVESSRNKRNLNRIQNVIKNVAGEKFPIHEKLKQEIVEFCKVPDQKQKLEKFLNNCEQLKKLVLAGNGDAGLKKVLGDDAAFILGKAAGNFNEIFTLVNVFMDRFVSMNLQVHTDGMCLRLLLQIPSDTNQRTKDNIEAADAKRVEQLKLAKTDEEKEAIQRMMGFTTRSVNNHDVAWQKAEWVEEDKNPSPATPFVKGDRVITFLSKAPGAVSKVVRVPLNLESLGELTHEQCLQVFEFLRELRGEDMKPPFDMTDEKFQLLQEIKRNFNTTLINEMVKAYMTLDE